MNILQNDSELRATRSYNVNDNGNIRTFFDDTYFNIGGFQRIKDSGAVKGVGKFLKRKDERREKRIDARQATKNLKRVGTADKRSSERVLAEAAAKAASQPAPRSAGAKSNTNLYIGIGIAVAVVGAFLLLKKKK